jgi:hypothetical protein
MSEFELREFVCKQCEHKVVVHPNYPKDRLPNLCMQCYETIVKPEQDRRFEELTWKLGTFFRAVGLKPLPGDYRTDEEAAADDKKWTEEIERQRKNLISDSSKPWDDQEQ